MQENKYRFEDGKIINRATGVAIPDDEPVFVLRAQDRNALAAVAYYAGQCGDAAHFMATKDVAREFMRFREDHPDRMKEPDTAPKETAA